jgi:hypothetical protein
MDPLTKHYRYEYLMILERIREVYDNCMGVHYNTAGVTSSAFQRVARKIGVQAAATDLIFVKICADATRPGGFKIDHLNLAMFTDAVYMLAIDGGPESFAERSMCEEKADILRAVVDAYFDDESDRENSDSEDD